MTAARVVAVAILCWYAGSVLASPGPSPGVAERYREPSLRGYRWPSELASPGGCPFGRGAISLRLEFRVGRDGDVRHVRMLRSTGDRALDERVLAVARQFRFTPKVVDWEAQAFTTAVGLQLAAGPCRQPPVPVPDTTRRGVWGVFTDSP